MVDFAYSLGGFLVAVAILVAVHEFGHFWVARLLGVKVLKFSIGFGRSLFTWHRKDDPTEYVVGLVPLGGYVKMLDEREGAVDAKERRYAFNRKPLGVRSAIVFAGPAFNFLFAIAAIWLVFVVGSPDIEPVVGEVSESSFARDAGFLPGDELVAVDGKPVRTWGQYQLYMLHQAMKGNVVRVAVDNPDHGGRDLELDFSRIDQAMISGRAITSMIGLWPVVQDAVIGDLVPGKPAEKSGLEPGDRVVTINGDTVGSWSDMVRKITQSPGHELVFGVGRDASVIEVEIIPDAVTVDGVRYGQIGVYRPRPDSVVLRFGPLESIWQALDYNWRMTAVTLRSLGRMLTARMSSENLSGPITIARIAGRTAASGFVDFLRFLAVISISLGLLNLLPIPVLDGGHLMYFLYEAITGKEPSEAVMNRGYQLGLLIIMLLMFVAFYNDIARLL